MKIDTKPTHEFSYSQIANHGFTFALLDGNRYLHTPFMCKDYLQDIFWSEATGKEGNVCGLVWKPGMLKQAPRYRFGLHGGRVKLDDHTELLQEFLNHFENALGFNRSEVLETEDPYLIVVDFPAEWAASGPMISAFTTLIRAAGAYQGGDPLKYLQSINKPLLEAGTYKQLWKPDPPYMAVEIQRFGTTLPRLAALLKGRKPDTTHADVATMSQAHYMGVMSYPKFPVEKM